MHLMQHCNRCKYCGVKHDEGRPASGLRARKREATHRRLAEAALELFLKDGFEATTVDAIAAAAGVSRRSFFHYFDSKEAIGEVFERDADAALAAVVVARPADEPPLRAARLGLLQLIDRYASERAVAFDRFMRSTPALRARKQAGYERQERALFEALAQRWPDLGRRAELRAAAMVTIGALRLAAEAWSADGAPRSLRTYLEEVFAALDGQRGG